MSGLYHDSQKSTFLGAKVALSIGMFSVIFVQPIGWSRQRYYRRLYGSSSLLEDHYKD